MGICYSLICTSCKKSTDLGKNREFAALWPNGMGDIEKSLSPREPYYGMLLQPLRFMLRHKGHQLTLTSDCDDSYGEDYWNYPEEDLDRPPSTG